MRNTIGIIRIISVLLMAVTLLVLSMTAVSADDTSSVQITLEAPDEVSPDSDFAVTVNISQVEGFDAASFHLHYDSALLRLDKVDPGKIGSTAVPIDVFNNKSAENKCIVGDNIPGFPCVNGAGYLNIFHFHVVGSGGQTVNLSFSNGAISHCGGVAAVPYGKIPSVWRGKTIRITGETSSPPPAALQSGSPSSTGGSNPLTSGAPSSPMVLLAPTQGVTDISDYITTEGKFGADVTVKSTDGAAKLAISGGTVGLTGEKSVLEQIGVYEMTKPPSPSGDYHIASKVFEMGPDKATFKPPITLTISYTESDIPANVDESALVIAYWDNSAEKYIMLDSSVDKEQNTVTAEVEHFTAFGILAPLPSASPTASATSPVVPAPASPAPAPAIVQQQQPAPSPSISTPAPAVASSSQPALPSPERTGGVLNWWLTGGVIGGIVVVIALVVFLRKRRSLSP